MDLTDVAKIRLTSQQIVHSKYKTVKEIVDWMGAMQAQDYAMAKWAIGLRLPNSIDQEIVTAINNGEIIRTHILRPTWHFISSDDILWMLALTAHQIKAAVKSRHNQLGLSETICAKSNKIIENALRGGKHLIREELLAELGKVNIPLDENRASHLLLRAELDGIVCSGAIKGGKQTYALLHERIPSAKSLSKDEALAKLARNYFTSHGPATLQDFSWWSGLPMSNAKHAMEMVNAEFYMEVIDSQSYWFTKIDSIPNADKETVHVLPAFDEFIISYKNRSASLPIKNHNKTVSNNGIFRPIIVVNGQVVGIWKRTTIKNRVIAETQLFEQPEKNIKSLIENAFQQYGRFLEKKVEIEFK